MKLKIVSLILISMLFLFQSGCWNAREIDELAFVIGIALDKTPHGGVKVTVQLAKPSSHSKSPTGGEQDKPYWIASSEGETFFEAIRDMHTFSSRRIFWSHNKVIIIGEELARSNISEALDFFSRNPELRLRTWVAVATGDAAKILESATGMEKDPATSIENVLGQRVWTGKGYGIMLKDFLEDYIDPSAYPVAARITANQEEAGQFTLTGAAVFNNNKMAGWLDEKETRGLQWLKGVLQSTVMVIPCPLDDKPLSVEIVGANVKYESSFANKKPRLSVKAEAVGNLSEQACSTDFTEIDNLRQLEAALSQAVSNDINATITAAQDRLALDFPGFSQTFHIQHKNVWKTLKTNWPTLFKTMEVDIDVKAEIPRQTLFARPLPPVEQQNDK